MTSRLTKEEFELRLNKMTNPGPPWIMSSPFAIFTIFSNCSKPFYGEFDKNQFQLTRNSIAAFHNTYYIVIGQYSENEDSSVVIKYQIKPLRFHYYASRVSVTLLLIFINVTLLLNNETVLQLFIFANLIMGLLLFIRFKVESLCKNRLEQRFIDEFRLKP